jgi:hypothetical protein
MHYFAYQSESAMLAPQGVRIQICIRLPIGICRYLSQGDTDTTLQALQTFSLQCCKEQADREMAAAKCINEFGISIEVLDVVGRLGHQAGMNNLCHHPISQLIASAIWLTSLGVRPVPFLMHIHSLLGLPLSSLLFYQLRALYEFIELTTLAHGTGAHAHFGYGALAAFSRASRECCQGCAIVQGSLQIEGPQTYPIAFAWHRVEGVRRSPLPTERIPWPDGACITTPTIIPPPPVPHLPGMVLVSPFAAETAPKAGFPAKSAPKADKRPASGEPPEARAQRTKTGPTSQESTGGASSSTALRPIGTSPRAAYARPSGESWRSATSTPAKAPPGPRGIFGKTPSPPKSSGTVSWRPPPPPPARELAPGPSWSSVGYGSAAAASAATAPPPKTAAKAKPWSPSLPSPLKKSRSSWE